MSFSKPREVNRNPAKKYIEWKGASDQGHFHYYDKDKEQNVIIELNEFVVLDSDLFSITGYDEPTKTRYVSNEVRTINDVLIIRGYKDKRSHVHMQGTYAELKDVVKNNRDLRYTKCLYIMLNGELCHLKLNGTAAYEFGDAILRGGNMQKNVVCHTETIDGKKGASRYKTPKFAYGREITADEANNAFELDSTVLQPYLEKYMSKSPGEAVSQETVQQHGHWSEYKDRKGKHLGEYSIAELYEAHDSLVELGDVDGPEYEAVHEAVMLHKQLQNTLEDKKDKQGKAILDYELDELQRLSSNTPYNHKAKLLLLTAIERKLEEEPPAVDEDDDSIPF